MTENRNRYAYTMGEEKVTNPDWLEEITEAKHIGPGSPGNQLIEVKMLIQVSDAAYLRMKGGK